MLYLNVILGLVLSVNASVTCASDLAVIVSARTPIDMLRTDQVADIFLSKVDRFPDGSEAIALDQKLGSASRNDFYKKLVHFSPALMKTYWTKLIFTGRGQPPAEVEGDDAVRKAVADNPGVIGYVEATALDPSVRAVLIVR